MTLRSTYIHTQRYSTQQQWVFMHCANIDNIKGTWPMSIFQHQLSRVLRVKKLGKLAKIYFIFVKFEALYLRSQRFYRNVLALAGKIILSAFQWISLHFCSLKISAQNEPLKKIREIAILWSPFPVFFENFDFIFVKFEAFLFKIQFCAPWKSKNSKLRALNFSKFKYARFDSLKIQIWATWK